MRNADIKTTDFLLKLDSLEQIQAQAQKALSLSKHVGYK